MVDGEPLTMTRKGVIENFTTQDGVSFSVRSGMFGDVRIVRPIKNRDGSWNWPNFLFGGWGNLGKLLLLLLIIASVYYGLKDLSDQCTAVVNNPCFQNFCIRGIA